MQKKSSLLPLFFIVLLDMLGIGIIIPIIAPIMLDPSIGVLPQEFSFETRNFLLGLLVAIFPLFQFFGAPILGALSDRHGRKKLLIVSVLGGFGGYVLFALGIHFANIWLLFLGRVIAGFMGGNISIAFSSIADMSDQKSKAKNFGMIGMAFGFGFIIGPYLGGKLADPNFISWLDFSTPIWFAAILSLVNVFMVYFMLNETLKTRIESKISVLTGFRNIANAFRMQNLRTIFLVILLHAFGFSFFTQFFQVMLIEKFGYNQVQIGNVFAYTGLWIAFTQGVVTRIVAKKFSPPKVLKFSIIGLSVALLLLIFPKDSSLIYFILPLIALTQGLVFPNSTAIVSNLSDPKSQGEVLGINQSLQSLALTISPIIAGIIVSFNINLPVIMASALIFLSWFVFIVFFKEDKKEVYHEI